MIDNYGDLAYVMHLLRLVQQEKSATKLRVFSNRKDIWEKLLNGILSEKNAQIEFLDIDTVSDTGETTQNVWTFF